MLPNIDYDDLKKYIVQRLCDNEEDNMTRVEEDIILKDNPLYTISIFVFIAYKEHGYTDNDYFNGTGAFVKTCAEIVNYYFDVYIYKDDKNECLEVPFYDKLKDDIYNEYEKIICE